MMAESAEVPKPVVSVVSAEAKCVSGAGSYQDLPKSECNGNNHHNQANELDKSYVFVSGADGLPDDDASHVKVVVAEGSDVDEKMNLKSGKIRDLQSEEVNGRNVDPINGDPPVANESSLVNEKGIKVSVADSLEEHAREFDVEQVEDPDRNNESFAEALVEKVGDRNEFIDGANDGEHEKSDELRISDAAPGILENQGYQTGGSDLAGLVENGESNNIPSHINHSGDANGDIVERNENIGDADDGEQEEFDELRISDTTPDIEKNQVSHIGVSDLVAGLGENWDSNNIPWHINSHGNSNGEIGDKNEINGGAVVGEQEEYNDIMKSDSAPGILENQGSQIGGSDLVAGLVGNKESNNISSYVNGSGNATGEYGSRIKLSAYETSEACLGSQDVVKLGSEMMVETHEVSHSTSLDVDLESNLLNNKEVIDLAEDGVECELQDVIVRTEDDVKLSEHEVLPITSLDFESNAINTKEEMDTVEDVVECEYESQDLSVKAGDEIMLSGEVLGVEHAITPSTSWDLDFESNPVNTKEQKNVDEDTVECELQDSGMQVEDDTKLLKLVGTTEHEFPLLSSLDFESNQINANQETDVVEPEVQNVSMEAEDEVNLAREVAETAENEIHPTISLDLDLESSPINNKEETDVAENVFQDGLNDLSVRAEDDIMLSGEVLETAGHGHPPSTSLDLDLNRINIKEDTDVVEEVLECELEHASMKVECEVKLSGEMMETEERQIPPSTSLDLDMESDSINTKEEKDMVVDCELQDASMKAKDDVKILEEVTETAAREVPLSTSFDSESDPLYTKKEINLVVDSELEDASVIKAKNVVKSLDEVIEIAEHEVLSPTSHVTFGPEVHVVINSGDDVTCTCTTEVSDISSVNKEGTANIELEIEYVEDMVDQTDGAAGSSNENMLSRENEDKSTHVDPKGCSSTTVVEREEASIKTKRKPFNFLIRVPRFDDESLREQIRLAKLNIDEKTKLRDAIQVQIQETRASTQIHGMDYEYAKGEGRNARKLVRSKRMEIDSLQSVINKAKNALSIQDIDSQIYNMEHMIQHETLPLKEEKQLIREIKQLKQLREQLSYNMGSQDEIKQALEQREESAERLKILRKELDVLKDKVLKAEAAAVEAEKKYDDENKKVRELQAQFRAADDVRQEAYFQWQSLRKELSEKSQHYFKYKDDVVVASNLVFSRNTEALYRLCMNNVECFMELWNTNEEFRRDYVKFNTRSTVRRFGTLDGRPLGPDEERHILPSYVDNRNVYTRAKVDLESQFPALEAKQERTVESVNSDDNSSNNKVTEEKCQRSENNKGPIIPVQENGSETVSGLDISTYEEPKKSREEIEAIKKSEEKESREAEAKLKEQRRLEALAKAQEARERKKRQAEKLQMRAEVKTIKEAEQKEKEREKRLRKKERKKFAATDTKDFENCEIAPRSESSKEQEVKDASSSVTVKKPKKHWLFGKHGKAKSIPPTLRNRNKKKWQQFMWVGITSTIILILFWLGNITLFSKLNYIRRSPVL